MNRKKNKNNLIDLRKNSSKNNSSGQNYKTETHPTNNQNENNDVKFKVYTDLGTESNHRINYEVSIDETDNYYQLNPNKNFDLKSIYDKRRGSTSQDKRKIYGPSKLLGNSMNEQSIVNKSMHQLSKVKNLPQIFTAATPVKTGYQTGQKNKACRNSSRFLPSMGFSINQTPHDLLPALDDERHKSVTRINKIAEKVGFKLPRSLSHQRNTSVKQQRIKFSNSNHNFKEYQEMPETST